MRPSWRPDPSGRHDYRWWTGVEWSDQVGDRGAVSIDPRPVPGVADAELPADVIARRRRLVAFGGVAVVAVVAAGATVVLRRGGDDPVVRELAAPGTGPVERRVSLRAGEVIRFRVEPSLGLDPHVVVSTDGATAEQIAAVLANGDEPADDLADRLFPSASVALDLEDPAPELGGQVALLELDAAGTDRPEAGWFLARADGDYRLIVVDAPPVAAGRFRTVVEPADERFPVDAALTAAAFSGAFFTDASFFDSAAPYAG